MNLTALSLCCLAVLSVACTRSSSEYIQRGERQLKENKGVEAVLSFRRAVQADPNSGAAYKALGQAALKQGEINEAYQAFNSAAELLGQDVEVHEQLADIVLGAYLANVKRPAYLKDRLLTLATKIERLSPQSIEVPRVRGMLAGAEGNAAEALVQFRKANAIPPFRPGLKLLEVQAMLDSGDEAGAEAAAYGLLEKTPNFGPGYDWLLRLYQRQRDVKKAETLLLKKVEANPNNITYQLQLARLYSQIGNAGAAGTVIGESLQKATGKNSLIEIGDYYLSFGAADKAVDLYRQALSLQPPTPLLAHKRLAVALGMQSKFPEAISHAAEARKLDAQNIEAVRIEAELRARSGQPKDLDIAISIFRELIIRSANDAGARYGLAVALLTKGDTTAAREQLRHCISINPHHRAAIGALAGIYRASREYRGLVLLAESILNQDANNITAKLLRAEGFIGEKRLSEARASLLPLVEIPGASNDATLLLATVFAAEKNYSAAERLLRRALDSPARDLRVVYALSDVLLAQKRQPEVVEFWRREAARNPKSVPLQRGLAKSLYLTGNYEQAITHYRTLLSANSADVESTAMLAVSLYAKGSREEAMTLFKKASEMSGANQTLIEGLMAYLYQADANGAAAEFYYRRVLVRDPDNHTVLNNLAYYLAEKGSSLDEAARLAGQAVSIQKENLDYQDTLAFVSVRAGKAQEAAQTLNSLVKRVPGNPSYRFHLGLALVQLGRKEEARQEFAAALARSPSPDLAARIKLAVTQL